MSENLQKDNDSAVSRRKFLTGAAATAAAAVAVGGGAALVRDKISATTGETAIQGLENAVLSTGGITAVVDPTQSPDLFTQLAAAQADNIRLQAALEEAKSQLDSYATASQDATQTNADLSLQLGEANNQIGILAGLVTLYEQMEDVDLGELLSTGAEEVSEHLQELVEDFPTLRESIQAGKLALQDIDERVPQLQAGRTWIKEQTGKLQTHFGAIEVVLKDAAEQVGSVFEMLNNWFADIRKWLPFGMGDKAAEVMTAITALLMEVPQTVSGFQDQMGTTLDLLLEKDEEGNVPLQRDLIKPLQTDVLEKTNETLSKTDTAEQLYQSKIKRPLTAAADSQRLILEQIADYRQKHKI